MNQVKSLSDFELLIGARDLRAREKEALYSLLLHLGEIDERKLYLEQGYSSLFSYLEVGLGYSKAASFRRVEGARFLRVRPELYEKLCSGEISFSSLVELAKCKGLESVDSVVEQSVGKSAQEVSELVQREVAPVLKRASREKIRVVKRAPSQSDTPLLSASSNSEETVSSDAEPNYEIAFEADEEFMRLYREAKAIAGGRSVKDVLSKVLKDFTKRNSPKERIKRREKRVSVSRPVTGRRIPAAVKDEVRVQDGFCCSYVSPDGRRCGEKSHLEFDHVKPFALGGASTSDNIRLLCRAHNQFVAERVFGRQFMDACRRE